MKEIIFLRVSKKGVHGFTKNLPSLSRGEIPVKLTLTVEDSAFREPVVAKEVTITDWREGIDIADVEFKEAIITEEEASLIKQRRLAKMRDILKQHGYNVEEPTQQET